MIIINIITIYLKIIYKNKDKTTDIYLCCWLLNIYRQSEELKKPVRCRNCSRAFGKIIFLFFSLLLN